MYNNKNLKEDFEIFLFAVFLAFAAVAFFSLLILLNKHYTTFEVIFTSSVTFVFAFITIHIIKIFLTEGRQ